MSAINFLQKEGLIKKINKNPGPGLTYVVGRPKTYSTITKAGLRKLMHDKDLTIHKFWKILVGYVIINKNLLTLEEIEGFYQIFLERYLKYHSRSFSFHLDAFHYICAKFEEIIYQSSKITTAQKVIEVLSICPDITFEELSDKSGELEFNVRQVLNAYSISEPGLYGERYSAEYAGLLTHNIIIVTHHDGKISYRLSIFGLVLALGLIRYNDAGILKNGLFFKDFTPLNYYDKMAYSYKEKLPLIFGPWYELKNVLNEIAVYNFDVIIDKGFLPNGVNMHSNITGNEGLCESLRTMILYNSRLMWDFAGAALEVLEDLPPIDSVAHEVDKAIPLATKIQQVVMLLCPASTLFRTPDFTSIFRKMEEEFAEEISALYYLNFVQVSIKQKYHYPDSLASNLFHKLKLTPQQSLSLVLKADNEKPLIRGWLSRWAKDLATLQNQTFQDTLTNITELGLK